MALSETILPSKGRWQAPQALDGGVSRYREGDTPPSGLRPATSPSGGESGKPRFPTGRCSTNVLVMGYTGKKPSPVAGQRALVTANIGTFRRKTA